MPAFRPTLSFKLFIAVLATAMLVVVAMVVASNLSFTRGFVGYLNEQAVARMQEVLPRAEAAYRKHGSWDFLRDRPHEWFPLVLPRPQQDDDHAGDGPRRSPDEDDHHGNDHRDDGNGDARRPPGRPSHAASEPPFEPPISDLTGAGIRLGLLDADGKLVAGYQRLGPDALKEPIMVDGRRVGWLAMAAFQSVSVAGGNRFRERQLVTSVVIGGVALVLAGVVALWFGRVLLAPLRRVTTATHALAAGAYATRVATHSRDEIGQFATDFNSLAQALDRNEKMRRDFIADISHELRTPLGVLHGELEAVEDGVRPLNGATVASLQAEVRTLNKLVSDLYDLSLSDVGALTYRKVDVDLVDLLAACVERQRDRFAARGLALELASPPRAIKVFGDERRLQQLVDNLCENSLRYTDAGGRLRIAVQVEAGRVAIDFSDTAPGVPADALPHLFDRFFRVDPSRNRAHGGAGLGLAICRNIVVAHDGTLLADASPLGGLRLVVTLPLAI